MKSIKLFFVSVVLLALVSSCSVEKRHYMKGYDITWHKKKPSSNKNLKIEEKTSLTKENVLEVQTIEAESVKENPETIPNLTSADNKKSINKTLSSKPKDASGSPSSSFKKMNPVKQLVNIRPMKQSIPMLGDQFLVRFIVSFIVSFLVTLIITLIIIAIFA